MKTNLSSCCNAEVIKGKSNPVYVCTKCKHLCNLASTKIEKLKEDTGWLVNGDYRLFDPQLLQKKVVDKINEIIEFINKE